VLSALDYFLARRAADCAWEQRCASVRGRKNASALDCALDQESLDYLFALGSTPSPAEKYASWVVLSHAAAAACVQAVEGRPCGPEGDVTPLGCRVPYMQPADAIAVGAECSQGTEGCVAGAYCPVFSAPV
jgi:hypothetical protein